MATQRMDRATRKAQIVRVMSDAHVGGVAEMTAGYIARKMGMRPSTHVRQMVFELWLDGVVDGRVVDTGCGVTDGIAYYRLPGTLTRLDGM
mgnify:CR=1 FL=1